MLLKDNDGDVGIALGIWEGYKPGVPGVSGVQGVAGNYGDQRWFRMEIAI